MKKVLIISAFLLSVMIFSSLVSAGIGIYVSEASWMGPENEEGSLTVGVYNPFPKDTYATVSVTGELKNILLEENADVKLIPAGTGSSEAIPLNLNFKIPKVYNKEQKILGLVTRNPCEEPVKTFTGEIVVQSVPSDTVIGGIGGSATQMAVSHEMNVRVSCTKTGWDYTILYITAALFSGLVVFTVLFKKYRKPKEERIKEKMQKLKAEMKKSKK